MYFDLSTLAETVAVDEGMIDNIKNKATDLRDKYRKAYHAGVTIAASGHPAVSPKNVLSYGRQEVGKKGFSTVLKVGKFCATNPIGKKLNKWSRPQSPVHNI